MKKTINETIKFLDDYINQKSNKLNEISATKIINTYNKFDSHSKRTKQKSRVLQAAIDRAPLRVDFLGENNKDIKSIIAIPIRNNMNFESNNKINKGFHIISSCVGIDIEEIKESALGLNRQAQKKFNNVDPIDNVRSLPKDLKNSFTLIVVNLKRESKVIIENLSNNIAYDLGDESFSYYTDDEFKHIVTEKIAKKLLEIFYLRDIEFDLPIDCRRYLKFLSELIMIMFGIDISKEESMNWHNFMT